MGRCIGLDVGYGFVKITDGDSGYAFPSVVGEGDLVPSLSTGYRKMRRVADLRIGVDGQQYFVGKLAIRRSNLAYRGLSSSRSEGDDFRVLSLCALSMFCSEPANVFNVVTGLPPGRMHLREALISQLLKDHKVTVLNNGRIREISITIEKLDVVPQPLGSFWSETLDSWGQIKNPILGRVGMVDIGFKTTDLVTIDDGDFIPEKSYTLPVGFANAYSDLSEHLLTEHGLEKESYALDEAFINGTINIAGQPVDISDFRGKSYNRVATKIIVELMSVWTIPEFHKIIVTGGGGAALGPYVLPYLAQGKIADDAVTANSIGFLNWANHLWRDTTEIEKVEALGVK